MNREQIETMTEKVYEAIETLCLNHPHGTEGFFEILLFACFEKAFDEFESELEVRGIMEDAFDTAKYEFLNFKHKKFIEDK